MAWVKSRILERPPLEDVHVSGRYLHYIFTMDVNDVYQDSGHILHVISRTRTIGGGAALHQLPQHEGARVHVDPQE